MDYKKKVDALTNMLCERYGVVMCEKGEAEIERALNEAYRNGRVDGLLEAAKQDMKRFYEIKGLGGIPAHLRAERVASACNHYEAVEKVKP